MTELIAKLKECLAEVEYFRQLDYTNQDWKLWRDKVWDLLGIHLGSGAEEQRRFRGSSVGTSDPSKRQRYYLMDIGYYETQLKSIIQKLELQSEVTGPVESTLTGAPRLPSSTHQKIQAVAGPLYASGHYASAIFEAFKAVNNEVKLLSGLDKDGQQLMAAAFDENHSVLRLNALQSQSDRDEQAGFKFLYMGAILGIRNPKAHDNVANPDEARTLEYLSFASLLMRRLDDANNNTL